MPRRAFNLIELLIVVAIIAILAAIAVPNFLEAQVRAKVTRVRNDLRTQATGLEAYKVDNNTYPLDINRRDGNHYVWYIWDSLTSPVAYLTGNDLHDPFREGKVPNPANRAMRYERFRYVSYEAADYNYLNNLLGSSRDLVEYRRGQQNYGAYRLSSAGPDGVAGPYAGGDIRYVRATLLYDATNGTISHGDIVRSQKSPEGPYVHEPIWVNFADF